MLRERTAAKYERWWLNKMCRVNGNDPFRKCIRVRVTGPPSGVYADVELDFEDGTSGRVQDFGNHTPGKYHVEVMD